MVTREMSEEFSLPWLLYLLLGLPGVVSAPPRAYRKGLIPQDDEKHDFSKLCMFYLWTKLSRQCNFVVRLNNLSAGKHSTIKPPITPTTKNYLAKVSVVPRLKTLD